MKSDSISASTAFAISSGPPQRPSGVARSTASDSSAVESRRREDRAWRDRIHENLIGREFERERLGQRLHAGFRHVIRDIALVAGPRACRDPVREIDDAAAALIGA